MSVPLIDQVVPVEPDREQFDSLMVRSLYPAVDDYHCCDCDRIAFCGRNSDEWMTHLIQVYKWALEQKERNLHGNK